ncbi:MAG TPA: hypothetical protein VK785_05465 [Opitutaceae bacterium]|nr:hypothetical protein [Opitutaceae bacterium]
MKNDRSDISLAETPEQLLETLRQLVAETERLLGDSSGLAAEKAEELRARINRAGEALRGFYGTARQKIITSARCADETIRSHPYESLAVSLGVGVLLGALIRRPR